MDRDEWMRANRAMNKLAKVYRAICARKLAAIGLHPGQDVLLWVLAQAPEGMTISVLADRLGVEQPTATRSLARLESGGWFVRQAVPEDRRQTRIMLTPRTLELVPQIERVWAELAEEGMGDLTPARRNTTVGALEAAVDRWIGAVDEAVLADG